jgi:hypothetical protein
MKEQLLKTWTIRLIQEQLYRFFMDEIIFPTGEFYQDGSKLNVTKDLDQD